jgi:hypothetical protein
MENGMGALAIGTKVQTLYEHSETATVVRPTKASLPLPGPDWCLIQFDSDGERLCAHRDMLAVSNQEAA